MRLRGSALHLENAPGGGNFHPFDQARCTLYKPKSRVYKRWAMPELWILSLMVVIVLVAFVAKGATGFGESLLIVTLFLLLLDIKVALPVALVTTAAADLYLLYHHHRDIHRPGLWVVLATAVLGVGLGTLLFTHLDSAALQTGFAVFVLLFAAKLLFFDRPADQVRSPHPVLGGVTGASAGFIDAIFGTGGPPIIMYLTWLGLDKSAFRATFIVMAFSLHSTRIVSYSVAGLLTREVLLTGLCLLPAMVAGALIGRRLHDRLDDRLFRKIAAVVLCIIGAKLLIG